VRDQQRHVEVTGGGRWAVKDPNAIGTNSTLMVISPTTFEPTTASAVFGPASGCR
jgi:hypothetical protein